MSDTNFRVCYKCGILRNVNEFYARYKKCKRCVLEYARHYYHYVVREDPEKLQKKKVQVMLSLRKFREAHPRNWEKYPRYKSIRHPLKEKARYLANKAERNGLIRKPQRCESCLLKTNDLEKHHDDYSKPLSVRWLCTKCHGVAHRMPIPALGALFRKHILLIE